VALVKPRHDFLLLYTSNMVISLLKKLVLNRWLILESTVFQNQGNLAHGMCRQSPDLLGSQCSHLQKEIPETGDQAGPLLSGLAPHHKMG